MAVFTHAKRWFRVTAEEVHEGGARTGRYAPVWEELPARSIAGVPYSAGFMGGVMTFPGVAFPGWDEAIDFGTKVVAGHLDRKASGGGFANGQGVFHMKTGRVGKVVAATTADDQLVEIRYESGAEEVDPDDLVAFPR